MTGFWIGYAISLDIDLGGPVVNRFVEDLRGCGPMALWAPRQMSG